MSKQYGKEPKVHGTMSTYSNYGCRCDPCRDAGRTYHREYYERTKERRVRKAYTPEERRYWQRRHNMKRKYGITTEQYNEMLEAQANGCAVCGSEVSDLVTLRRLAVDHDHVTGKVRGLLCAACNRGIGHFSDDPVLLEIAAQYVRSHHGD